MSELVLTLEGPPGEDRALRLKQLPGQISVAAMVILTGEGRPTISAGILDTERLHELRDWIDQQLSITN